MVITESENGKPRWLQMGSEYLYDSVVNCGWWGGGGAGGVILRKNEPVLRLD